MMRSLSSAVAGLRAHQTKMDVIGTNIANVNTYGFKSSRVTFSDVYYQTLGSGSAPATAMGGTNPTQIGYGSMVATIDVLNAQSGLASTDRAMDIYINGEGMIATKDVNGNLMYSRLGVLGFDAEGNLVDASGNFVMGFPMKDGVPQVRPDGTVSIEDLSRIKVDPEMLDQMTGISIGPTGDIVGTLPGETTTTQNNKRPAWLISAEPVKDSYVQGDIKVTMEWKSELATGTPLPSWIKSMDIASNSMVSGNLNFVYNESLNQIQVQDGLSGQVLYTGTYRQNNTVDLVNAKGDVAFTLQTDPYNKPVDGSSDGLNFNCTQTVTVNYTDKGGNKIKESAVYDGIQSTLTVGDIVLQIAPDAVETKDVASFDYDHTNAFAAGANAWLQNVYLSDSSYYPHNEQLSLAAGVKKSVSFMQSGNNAYNWIDRTALDKLIKDIDDKGNYRISTSPVNADGTGGFVVEITYGTGQKIVSDPVLTGADHVVFNYGSDGTTPLPNGPHDLGAISSTLFSDTTQSAFSAFTTATGITAADVQAVLKNLGYIGNYSVKVTDDGGGVFTVDILNGNGDSIASGTTDATGSNLTIEGHTFASTVTGAYSSTATLGSRTSSFEVKNPANLANMTERNTLQLLDESGNVLGEAVYNGSNRVPLGDMVLQVDKDKLNDLFITRKDIDATASKVQLGRVQQGQTENWAWDANVANAQPGIGESYVIGNIALAKIPNMVAMEQFGSSYFVTSANSGEPKFIKPGLDGTGTLTAGYLEMSNVDISKEFTDMITTQRGFQANTRIITVSDEMLQELVNLKR